MSEDQKKQLEQQLWNIANELRGKMNADEFRDYILGFIFYKYLSEKQLLSANQWLEKEKINYKDLINPTKKQETYLEAVKESSIRELGYFLPPQDLFHSIAEKGNQQTTQDNFILDDLQRILQSIEQSTMGTDSEDDFDKLFEEINLNSAKLGRTEKAKNDLVSKILFHLNQIDFQLEDSQIDVLGDAYEYLISQFAAGAGKKAGEFYTPQEVSTILAKIVTLDKNRLKNVYDPTCGSGSLLLRVAKEIKKKGGQIGEYCGQELNRTTYNLARMNMILHDVHYKKFDIKQEDTIEKPQHLDKKFEAIVANPPFSAKWSSDPIHMNDDRFNQYGNLAPKSYADYAFIQHMLHQLDENGTMAVVMPHGVLFRGSSEGKIRQHIISELNYLDAVIGLPANVFYGTSIPTSILVFKKCRTHSDDILFIDAAEEYEKAKNQNLLKPEHIQKIVNTYNSRKTIDKFSYLASIEEIKENDYNLNIPRYVDNFEEEEPIDLQEVTDELLKIEKEMKPIDAELSKYCEELGIPNPFK